MDLDTMWLRIFDHSGSALAFIMLASVAGWLATRKFIGHRSLLFSYCFFGIVRSTMHVYLIYAYYAGTTRGATVDALLTLSTVVGLWVAVHTMLASGNLLVTLTRTEAMQLESEESTVNRKQWMFLPRGTL